MDTNCFQKTLPQTLAEHGVGCLAKLINKAEFEAVYPSLAQVCDLGFRDKNESLWLSKTKKKPKNGHKIENTKPSSLKFCNLRLRSKDGSFGESKTGYKPNWSLKKHNLQAWASWVKGMNI